jgi:hypothetical protein
MMTQGFWGGLAGGILIFYASPLHHLRQVIKNVTRKMKFVLRKCFLQIK